MSKSIDYHDYVFRDGKLVGEFEEMYRNSEIVPWHQDEQDSWIDVRLTKEMIRDIGANLDQIHDLGCGTGHYLNLIAAEFLAPQGTSYGYDISETACQMAANTFPESKFAVLNLAEPRGEGAPTTNSQDWDPSLRRLFMIRGTLWYVCAELATVVDNIRAMMTVTDKLLVVQNFPPLETEFIGKEAIPNHKALVDHFSHRFVLDRHIWYEDRFGTTNDNWFIGLFSSKG